MGNHELGPFTGCICQNPSSIDFLKRPNQWLVTSLGHAVDFHQDQSRSRKCGSQLSVPPALLPLQQCPLSKEPQYCSQDLARAASCSSCKSRSREAGARQSRQSTEATRGRGAKATETGALARRRESSSGTGADFRLQTRTFFLMWE